VGTKKNTSMWIEPDVLKKIKHLSVEHGVPIGDVIKALLRVAELEDNPAYLKQCIISERDSFAMYVNPEDPLCLSKELHRRRTNKRQEIIEEDRLNGDDSE